LKAVSRVALGQAGFSTGREREREREREDSSKQHKIKLEMIILLPPLKRVNLRRWRGNEATCFTHINEKAKGG
jgi:hypothetical protein